MDLIYADQNRKDIGILRDYDFDLAYGVDENNFSLKVDISQHCCQDDYIIYMVDPKNGYEEPTEYGGIIDAIQVDTSEKTVTYSGRTWHGILAKKVISPDSGSDYKIVTGDAGEIISSLISEAGLSSLFMVGASEISISSYQFARYVDMYTGICDMLATFGGKLKVTYTQKKVELSAVWLVDYSQDDEWDSSQVNFKIKKNINPVNHLVCLGQGDLRERAVIHLFTDDNGGVQPYAFTTNPVKDADYILDKRNQRLFSQLEVSETYDNSGAGTTDNYVLQTSQPSDWDVNYSKYYYLNGTSYATPTETKTESLTVLSSTPANWSTNYGDYYTSDGKSVQGVETESYVALTAKPSDWSTNWQDYYVHYWDGVQWFWNTVESVSWTDYKMQTQKPSDWESNFGSYYKRQAIYKEVKKNGKGVKDAKGNPVKKKVGVGYVSVTKVKDGKKEKVPAWRKQKYYTGYSMSKAPNYNKGLAKYRQVVSTVAPTVAANTYYTKTTTVRLPVWAHNTYYTLYHDRYAALVQGGLERLKTLATNGDSISINLSLLGEYDVGDVVGANENVTGIAVWQPITKKIVSIKNNQKTISYQIGASK